MLDLKITTLLIEKDKESLKQTETILKQFSELSVIAKATSGKQGMALGNNFVPRLVFLNIDLPDINGLEFVRILRNRTKGANIVFMANDTSHAFESLQLEPFDYLVKPLEPKLIEELIVRLKHKIKRSNLLQKMDVYTKMQAIGTKRIFHQKKGIVVLHIDEIVFCKAELTSTNLKLRTGENIILKTKIGETIEIINNKDFVRTGRSYYINHRYLRKIDKKNCKCELYYIGQTWYVPVSKNTISILEQLNVQPIY